MPDERRIKKACNGKQVAYITPGGAQIWRSSIKAKCSANSSVWYLDDGQIGAAQYSPIKIPRCGDDSGRRNLA